MGKKSWGDSTFHTMKENDIKIYIGEPLKDVVTLPILDEHLGVPHHKGNRLFRNIFLQVSFSFFDIVSRPEEADFLLIPHDYFRIHEKTEYIQQFVEYAQIHSKKIVIFVYGDTDKKVTVPHSIVLRTS